MSLEPSRPLRRPRHKGGRARSRPRASRISRPGNDLTAAEREFLSPALEILETPPSPAKRAVLWTVIAFVAVAITWATIGKISIVALAPGKFIPDGRVKEIQPLESSIVKAIHVKEGQRVKTGDLLLELDPSLNAAQLAADRDKFEFNQLEQTRLETELSDKRPALTGGGQPRARLILEEQTRQARESAYAAKLAQATATLNEKHASLDAALSTINKYRDALALTQVREAETRPLADSGAVSRDEYLKIKQEMVEDRDDLDADVHAAQQAQAAVDEADRALEQAKQDHKSEIFSDLNQRVTAEPGLKGDLEKSKQLYDLKWLRAPVDGIVQSVEVTTIGQVVTPAQSLVTIVPDGTPLIVEATVTNQDIGYIRVGQSVAVKVDTFPFQKYGTLKGTLDWISPDAEDKDAIAKDADARSGEPTRKLASAAQSPNAGYVYKVHVHLQETEFRVQGQWRSARSGMTVQADITTDQRRVIDFFLSPMVKYLDEGLKVR